MIEDIELFRKDYGPHLITKMLKSLKTISRVIPLETIVYPDHGFETRK